MEKIVNNTVMQQKRRFNWKLLLLFFLINFVLLVVAIGIFSSTPELLGVNKLRVKEKNGDTLTVELQLVIKNPNVFSISGSDITVTTQNNEEQTGSGVLGTFSLNAGETDTIMITMKMNTGKLMALYDQTGADLTSTVKLNGSFSPLFFVNQVSFESAIPKENINQLLMQSFFAKNDISFDSLNYRPVSITESRMDFNVNLTNTFAFPFTVEKLTADIFPQNGSQTVVGSWSNQKPVLLNPKAQNTINGNLSVHHMALMIAGLEKKGQNLNSAYIKGTATIRLDKEIMDLPFDMTVATDMSKIIVQKK